LVQKNALVSWTEKKNFKTLICQDETIKKLCTPGELETIFSQDELLSGIKKIFDRFANELK